MSQRHLLAAIAHLIALLGYTYCYGSTPPSSDSTVASPMGWDKASYYASLDLLENPGIPAPENMLSATQVQAGYENHRGNQWLTPYRGSAQRHYQASVLNYNRRARNASFGKAHFRKRRNDGTQWQLNQHPERVAPYTITDTIGGTQQTDEYLFEGGTTRKLKRLRVGINAGYQSSIMWKTLSPRPKNTTAEAYISTGASTRVLQSATLALGLSYSSYSQHLSVSSSPDDRKDMFYAHKGFGIIHKAISGTGNQYARRYKGHTFGASATLFGSDIAGSYISLNSLHETISTVESNNTIPFILNKVQVGVNGGVTARHTSSTYRVLLAAHALHSNGTEQFYERVMVEPSSTLFNWVLLTKGVQYTKQEHRLSLKTMRITEQNSATWYALTAKATYTDNAERYSRTSNRIESRSLQLFAQAHFNQKRGGYTLAATANVNQTLTMSSTVSLPDAQWPRKQDLEQHYNYLLGNATQWSARVSLLRALPKNHNVGISLEHSQLYVSTLTTHTTSIALNVLL